VLLLIGGICAARLRPDIPFEESEAAVSPGRQPAIT
jgi:hypothetical protein